jgi:hypothetical protein
MVDEEDRKDGFNNGQGLSRKEELDSGELSCTEKFFFPLHLR